MSIKVPKGNSFLKLKLITHGQFGTQGGDAHIDRLLMRDADMNLPFLADSGLKGVLADAFRHWQQPTSHVGGSSSEQLFGRETRWENQRDDKGESYAANASGQLIFGEAIPLCFPLSQVKGINAWVFPVSTLMQMATLDSAFNNSLTFLNDFDFLPNSWVGDVAPDELDASFDVDRERAGVPNNIDFPKQALCKMAGISVEDHIIIAGYQTAEVFFNAAAEIQTQTKIDQQTNIAESSSLRVIEMIPSRSVFVSFVTNLHNREVGFPDYTLFQFGAAESTASGFCQLQSLTIPSDWSTTPIQKIDGEALSLQRERKEALEALQQTGLPRDELRTRLRDFPMLEKQHGVSVALAFYLAKAKFKKPDPSSEVKAYRLVLEMLLPLKGQPNELIQSYARYIYGDTVLPVYFYPRLACLKNYAELELATVAGTVKNDEEEPE